MGGCQSHTFAQNTCLQLNGGGSAKAVCTSSALQMGVYPFSSDCTSMSETTEQPINQCVQDESGTYLENLCNNGAATAALETKGLIVSATRHARPRHLRGPPRCGPPSPTPDDHHTSSTPRVNTSVLSATRPATRELQ